VLSCFFVIAHNRRRILHVNVTRHPTSEWVAQQLREAFPYESIPGYLIFDQATNFDEEVVETYQALVGDAVPEGQSAAAAKPESPVVNPVETTNYKKLQAIRPMNSPNIRSIQGLYQTRCRLNFSPDSILASHNLAPRQGTGFNRVALRQEQAAEEDGARRRAAGAGRKLPPSEADTPTREMDQLIAFA